MSLCVDNTYSEDNLPPIVMSRYGEAIPLRARERSRISVISVGGGCWQTLCVSTAEVLDGEVVNEIGQGDSKTGDGESRDQLLWEWFSALKAAPTPDGGPDVVVFKPLWPTWRPKQTAEELKETEKKERKMIRYSKRMLQRFENIRFVPWTENEVLFFNVAMVAETGWSGCRPELSWEKEDESE